MRSSSFELYGGGRCSLFWDKKLMEKWYLRITEKFLFRAFWWWEMRSFVRQKVNGKMIFPDYWKVFVLRYWKVLVLNFSLMENTSPPPPWLLIFRKFSTQDIFIPHPLFIKFWKNTVFRAVSENWVFCMLSIQFLV